MACKNHLGDQPNGDNTQQYLNTTSIIIYQTWCLVRDYVYYYIYQVSFLYCKAKSRWREWWLPYTILDLRCKGHQTEVRDIAFHITPVHSITPVQNYFCSYFASFYSLWLTILSKMAKSEHVAERLLTFHGNTKRPPFRKLHFQTHFIEWNCFHNDFTGSCYWGFNWM